MQSIKEETLNIIKRLPESCSLDDIMETLWVQKRILKGQQQIRAGKGISHEAAKRRMKKWLK